MTKHPAYRLYHFLVAVPLSVYSCAVCAQPLAGGLNLTREKCQELMVNAADTTDVQYVPDMDAEGNPLVPADIEGRQNIKLPEEISIPLHINLEKYFKVPTTKTALALRKLQTLQNRISLRQKEWVSTHHDMEHHKMVAEDYLQTAEQALRSQAMDEESRSLLINLFERVLTSADKRLSDLNTLPSQLANTAVLLEQQTVLMDDQFKSHYNDAQVLSHLTNTRAKMLDTINDIQYNGRKSIEHLATIQNELNKVGTLVELSHNKFKEGEIDKLAKSIQLLQSKAEATYKQMGEMSASESEGHNNKMNALSQQINLLGLENNDVLSTTHGHIGVIKMLNDGRLYFNNQPLQDEEKAEILRVCRKILSQPQDIYKGVR